MKKRQSQYWLLHPTNESVRNRALSLCQCFLVSRFSDVLKWQISDLTSFTYSHELPYTGRYGVDVLYILQSDHKTIKDGRVPDLKLIVRHRTLCLCPLSAMSVMFFYRFTLSGEPFPDLVGSKDWYKKPIFKSSRSKGPIEAGAMYDQRREMMIATNTLTNGCINHQDRHIGTLIARLYNVSNSELESLGLWSQNVMEKFYSKYAVVDTVCKMSGYPNSQEFAIDRALPDFEDFRDNYGGAELFDIFLGELNNPILLKKAQDLVQNGENTTFNVIKALKYIIKVFWQDFPHYYKQYPEMPIFKSLALMSNWDKFLEWTAYVNKACDFEVCQAQNTTTRCVDEPNNLCKELDPQIGKTIDETRHLALSNKATLDRILYLMESQAMTSEKSTKKRERDKDFEQVQRNHPNKSAKLPCTNNVLQSMRKLNDMSLDDLWYEGTVKVVSEGDVWPSLKELDSGNQGSKQLYRSKSLKTTIERRRRICRFVEETKDECGSEKKALKLVKDLMIELGSGSEPCSLYKLSEHIRKL